MLQVRAIEVVDFKHNLALGHDPLPLGSRLPPFQITLVTK